MSSANRSLNELQSDKSRGSIPSGSGGWSNVNSWNEVTAFARQTSGRFEAWSSLRSDDYSEMTVPRIVKTAHVLNLALKS